MPLSTIDPVPTPPSRGDAPASFNNTADEFFAAFPTLVTQLNQFIAEVPAAVNGVDYNGTSATSVTIGTGSKTFTTQAGKNFQIGQAVRVARTSAPANYMDGQVTAYNSGTGSITVNVTAVGGTGTFTDWTISLAVSGSGFLPLTGGALTGALTTTGTISPGNVSNFYLSGTASTALLNFDANDYLSYDRTGNTFNFVVGGAVGLTMNASNATFTGTIRVQAASGSTGGSIGYTGGNLTFGNGSAQMTVVSLTGTQTLTNKTLTAPVINGGSIDATVAITDTGTIAGNSPGTRGVVTSANTTGTLALTDAGKRIRATGNWIIPANASVAFPADTTIVIVNTTASTITVSITSDTLRLAGSASTGTRTISAYGICTLLKDAATVWYASGHVT